MAMTLEKERIAVGGFIAPYSHLIFGTYPRLAPVISWKSCVLIPQKGGMHQKSRHPVPENCGKIRIVRGEVEMTHYSRRGAIRTGAAFAAVAGGAGLSPARA